MKGFNRYLKSNLKTPLCISLVIGILMGLLSLAGLIRPEYFYTTEEAVQSFMVNDLINMITALPVLLVSMWLTRRKKLIGLLFWPGALLMVVYNYTAYVFGIPFNTFTLAYITLVILSIYAIYSIMRRIDKEAVKSKLDGVVPVKLGGWFLVIFGAAFLLRAAGIISQELAKQSQMLSPEFGVLMADVILSSLWIAGGILLLRRLPLGFASGLGLLFAASMLFVGLILFLLIQPIFGDTSMAVMDIIFVSLMGLICFVPFVLYTRGVLSIEQPAND